MVREIDVRDRDSSSEGGCNGCTEHNGPGTSFRVWVMTFRGTSVRLCDDCMAELRAKSTFAFRAAAAAVQKKGANGKTQ